MTITFENKKDFIVNALEKIISYPRKNQYIVAAQCVWWLASTIGWQQGLIIHIYNLWRRAIITNNNTEGNMSPVTTEEYWTIQDNTAPRKEPAPQQSFRKDSSIISVSSQIHLDRRWWVNQREDTPERVQYSNRVPDKVERFLEKSEQQRRKVDPLRRTRKGKQLP